MKIKYHILMFCICLLLIGIMFPSILPIYFICIGIIIGSICSVSLLLTISIYLIVFSGKKKQTRALWFSEGYKAGLKNKNNNVDEISALYNYLNKNNK